MFVNMMGRKKSKPTVVKCGVEHINSFRVGIGMEGVNPSIPWFLYE